MKPLDQLDNVARAYLLHQLFPRQIPRFLEFAEDLGVTTVEQKEQLTEKWNHALLPVDMWIDFATVYYRYHTEVRQETPQIPPALCRPAF